MPISAVAKSATILADNDRGVDWTNLAVNLPVPTNPKLSQFKGEILLIGGSYLARGLLSV